MNRVLALTAALLAASCGGGSAGGGGGGGPGTGDALEAILLISPQVAAEIKAQFALTLRANPTGVDVVHWDPTVPAKVPPFLETDVATHGFLTIGMDDGALAQFSVDFPDGQGANGFTVRAENDIPQIPGNYHVVHFEVLAGLAIQPADPTLLYDYSVVFDSDGDTNNNWDEPATNFFTDSDRWYVVSYSDASGWTLTVTTADEDGNTTDVASAAFAVLTGNSVILLVPTNEFAVPDPSYRTVAFSHDGDFGVPAPHSWTGDAAPSLAAGLQPYPAQK